MTSPRFRLSLAVLALAATGPAGLRTLAAQGATRAAPAAGITEAEIDGHLRFLSSDLLEGRAPATRGGKLTAAYIASQLRAAGVEPGVDGSYLRRVPIDVRGKVLLVLVNDPPAPPAEPTLFGGKAMTYYGRWTYKFEEAERRGAVGP